MTKRLIQLSIGLVALVIGCAPSTAPVAATQPASFVPPEGTLVTIVQRQNGNVPAVSPRVRISIDDITAGQTLLTVRDAVTGVTLVPLASLKQGDSRQFEVAGCKYDVVVEQLHNLLTGDDFAEIRIKPSAVLTDRQRMHAAIERIRTSGLTFVRNGANHDSAAAAEHLQKKLDAAGEKVRTFEQFLEQVATKSSLSGEAYEVILPDGRRMPAREWIASTEPTMPPPSIRGGG